jgi:Uma2 family endonuclease
MVAVRKHAPARMTLNAFLVWDPGDRTGRTWQLIDGEAVPKPPSSDCRGALWGEIGGRLGNHLAARGSHGRVVVNPGIVPRVRASRNHRVPDICVTFAAPSVNQSVANPVLLIEILAPTNEGDIQANVWTYTTIPSVQEILIVSRTRLEAELLRRRPDGTWPEEPDTIGPSGTVMLASIDFSAPLAAFYRTTVLAPPP